MRFCAAHETELARKIGAEGIGHFLRERAESDLLKAIWTEPDSDGPERLDDFEPRAVALGSIETVARSHGIFAFHDYPALCPACRFPKAGFVAFGAESARNCYDRLVGGRA